MKNCFYNRDIVSIKEFNRDDLDFMFKSTEKLQSLHQNEKMELARGRNLGYIFFEPSTRTRLSFEAAMISIGGNSMGIADAKSSSVEKGESLADTVRVIDQYSDVIILRNPLDGSSRFAAEVAEKPVINAGSGTEEHPTQAMVDLYTIQKEKGRIDGLNIGIIGDLKYGRTVYSLLYGLTNYNVEIHLISPRLLKIRNESIFDVKNKIKLHEHEVLDDILKDLDVIYVTRIQKERFSDIQEYEKVKGSYIINSKILESAKSDVIIMHPLPRLDEVSHDLDNTPKAKYFKQAAYGKDVRATLLALVLNENF
ncbi:MAG: aspartate carbamoyltransferase [Thaumarchaeota archaeon]|nr:aspartate carbamoyltransferase [Nitrososphaerota archaeon]